MESGFDGKQFLKRLFKRAAITLLLLLLSVAFVLLLCLGTISIYGQQLEENSLSSLNDLLEDVYVTIDGEGYHLKATQLEDSYSLWNCVFPGELHTAAQIRLSDEQGEEVASFRYPVSYRYSRVYTQPLNPDMGWNGADWLMLLLERMLPALYPGRGEAGTAVEKNYRLGNVSFDEECHVLGTGMIDYHSRSQAADCRCSLEVDSARIRITVESEAPGGA